MLSSAPLFCVLFGLRHQYFYSLLSVFNTAILYSLLCCLRHHGFLFTYLDPLADPFLFSKVYWDSQYNSLLYRPHFNLIDPEMIIIIVMMMMTGNWARSWFDSASAALLSLQKLWFMNNVFLTLPLTINETLKWLSSLPILNAEIILVVTV